MSKKKLLVFSNDKARPLAFIFFLLIAVILFYLCRYLFFYDEDIFVIDPHSRFMSDFTRVFIVKLTFLTDNFLYGINATGYHITNILLHLCNTLLAAYTFRLLLRFTVLDERKAKNAAYIFLFLFLLSPIHSEPLCYLLGRAGLVVTFFCLLSLLFFLKANFKSTVLLLVSLGFFLLALFSYEISWTFPVIILLIANYLKQYQPIGRKKIIIYVAPFFIVFAVWFLFEIVLSNQLKVTPYGNDIFLSSNPVRLAKNLVVLFFRNIVPPFESTTIFVLVSIIVAAVFFYIFTLLKNKSTPLLFFALLIVVSCFIAYLPALVFGISSHNSESERYIYFSSVFAIMFLSLSISLLQNKQARNFVFITGCCIYAFFLFTAITNYVQGGKFSRDYLKIVSTEQGNAGQIFLVDQPSQYKGVLLLRANGDVENSSQKNFSTLYNFMHSLFAKNNSSYITLSKKQIFSTGVIRDVIHTSIDSLPLVFPSFNLNKTKGTLINSSTGDSTHFENGSSIIVGLKLSSLYIFK